MADFFPVGRGSHWVCDTGVLEILLALGLLEISTRWKPFVYMMGHNKLNYFFRLTLTLLLRENFLIFVKSSGEKLGWTSLLITLMLLAIRIVRKVPGVKPCLLDGKHR